MGADVKVHEHGGHHISGPGGPGGLASTNHPPALARRLSHQERIAQKQHVCFEGVRMTIPHKIWIATEEMSKEEIAIVEAEIDAIFVQVDLVFNSYNPTSEMATFNHMPAGKAADLTWETARFLQGTVQRCVEWSKGLYDPTVAPLSQHWQTRLSQGDEVSEAEITNLKDLVGWNKLQLHVPAGGESSAEKPTLSKSVQGMKCDLGGIAKGRTVDLLISRLQALGYDNVYVDWGGDIRACGQHSDRPWLSALVKPKALQGRPKFGPPETHSLRGSIESTAGGSEAGEEYLGLVEVTDLALATSGDYEKLWKVRGTDGTEKVFTHILNPLTGRALEPNSCIPASVSVIAQECALADGLATAAMALGDTAKCKAWLDEVVAQSNREVVGYCAIARDDTFNMSSAYAKVFRKLDSANTKRGA